MSLKKNERNGKTSVRREILAKKFMLWISEEAYVIRSDTGERERIRIEYPAGMTKDDLKELLQDQTVWDKFDGSADNDLPIVKIKQKQHWKYE